MAQYKKEDVRNKIIENAKAEFLEKGYQNASISSIAKNSHVGVGNVYRYFKNKEAILDAIVTPVVERIKRTLIESVPDELDENIEPHENIMNVMTYVLDEIIHLSKNHKDEILIVLLKSQSTQYMTIKEEIIQSLAVKIRRLMLQSNLGKVNAFGDLSVPISAALIEGCIRIILSVYNEDNEDNYDKLYIFARTILEGLLIEIK
ncbi:MAG: TetR/AcrR family transcriptional regulator [Tissierellales bacterium]|jgi:AcrR family transcriptional regulator|nr:TetR/AcrR family transcriptional regulator [Tissierellales bacterium]